MSRLVIADTSCLIVLGKTACFHVLQVLFDEITITPEVKAEYGDELPDWIIVKGVTDKKNQKVLELELDRGEASAIALGMENENVLLLIDERKGRKLAQQLGIKITGTLGVLIKAKEMGLIPSLKKEIEKLEAVGFRMSKRLILQILNKYGEE